MLTFQTRTSGTAAVLEASGSLRTNESDTLLATCAELIARGVRTVALDIRAIREVDAGGIGALLEARRLLSNAGGSLMLVRPNVWVRHLLDTCLLTEVFHVPAPDVSTDAVGNHQLDRMINQRLCTDG